MQGARRRPYFERDRNATDARPDVRGCLGSPPTPCGDVRDWTQSVVARRCKRKARAWARLGALPLGVAQQRRNCFATPAGSHFGDSAPRRRIPNAIVAHVFHNMLVVLNL